MKCCSFREGRAQLHVLNVQDEGRKLHKHTFAKPLVVAASVNRHGSDTLTWQASLSFSKNNEKQSPVQKYVARLLDGMEMNLVSKLEMNRPLPETVDPRIQLAGNFAPVKECCVHDNLEVVGEIPPCLDGVYVRNGANPRHEPSAGHHFFDGDGMIHAVKFHNGTASYSCRYTRTYRLEKEENMGRALFPKAIGELHGYAGLGRLLLYYARTLIGLFDIDKGLGVANAGLIFFNGTLLAMSEDDLPYAIRISDSGDLSTLGRFDFQGQLKIPMIAHPKLDPETGELFTLSYNVVKAPYLKYFYFTSDGKKSKDVDIELTEPVMIHDFAITNKYVVIPDQQMVFRLGEMLSGGSPMVYDKHKPCRFGIMPKYPGPGEGDTVNIRWVEVPDCFCFHLWNAWEEPDKNQVVVLGSIMKPPDTIFNFSPQHDEDQNNASFRSMLSEIRLDTVSGTCIVTPLMPPLNLEAGQVNRKLLGRRTKYAYMAIAEPWPKVSGIAKVDLEERSVAAMFSYDDGCFGGEPFFVPRTSDPMAPEDDGYVVGFVYDENRGTSELLILDASSPDLAEVGCVKIPSRVPYGFHGTFITSQELAMQTKSLAL